MTRIFEDQTFSCLRDDSLGLTLSDMEFRRCRFHECVFSNTYMQSRRSKFANAQIIDCIIDGGLLGPAIVEDVLIRNLTSTDTLFTRGMIFKHVTLSGRMGELVILPLYEGDDGPKEGVNTINRANHDYYREIDWAIDISNLECIECDIRCIPARLVRRDIETQAVVTRAGLADGRWRELKKNSWKHHLSAMVREEADDCVLIAGKKAKDFRDQLAGIRELRSAGIADAE
ncbi:MAG TPA: hypothetical protein VFI31_08895 [Pirellulales bacterium]|nr:hypothetical protein [Pirellulales bacterium]